VHDDLNEKAAVQEYLNLANNPEYKSAPREPGQPIDTIRVSRKLRVGWENTAPRAGHSVVGWRS